MGSKGAALSIQSLSQTDILRVQRLRYITVETTFEVCLKFFIVTIYSSTSQPQLLVPRAGACPLSASGRACACSWKEKMGFRGRTRNREKHSKRGYGATTVPSFEVFFTFSSSTSRPHLLFPRAGTCPPTDTERACACSWKEKMGFRGRTRKREKTPKEGTQLRPYPLLKWFSRCLVRPLNLCVA